jgi:3-oxoacyl-[acyl-carrier protein] reductase
MAMDFPVAVVTGASCAIGWEIARTLTRSGYAVVMAYLRDQAGVEAVVEEILAAGGTAFTVRADIADELDVERLFDETKAVFGKVDVIVHAAIRDASLLNRAAARQLSRGGAIVSVSSAGSVAPVLAEELRARDITVNGLAPGLEPPGANHDVAELVALVDRWRLGE